MIKRFQIVGFAAAACLLLGSFAANRHCDADSYARVVFTDAAEIFGSDVHSPRVTDDRDQSDVLRFISGNEIDRVACSTIPRDRLAVLLIAGQSNAHNSTRKGDTYKPRRKFFNLNIEDGNCYVAGEHALGATGEGSAFALPLADDLVEGELFANVLIVPIAIGGTYIEEWRADGGRYFPRFERALQLLIREGLKPTFVLWHQGEGNAGPLMTAQTFGLFGTNLGHRPVDVTPALRDAVRLAYVRHFNGIVAGLRKMGVTAPMLPAVATTCGYRKTEPSIREAQMALPNADAGIFPGPDTDTIDFAARSDGCHFSSQGIIIMAKMWVDSIKAVSR